jgi:hypothetical protein
MSAPKAVMFAWSPRGEFHEPISYLLYWTIHDTWQYCSAWVLIFLMYMGYYFLYSRLYLKLQSHNDFLNFISGLTFYFFEGRNASVRILYISLQISNYFQSEPTSFLLL